MQKPLAEILRPTSLEDYLGQEHLTGEGGVLQASLRSGQLPSMVLWGPPGVGKTTLAHILAGANEMNFFSLSAINSGVKDVREVINRARMAPRGAILFIDEIHRFSKSQQDSLLSAVERGIITLIGATTENPSFEVIPALLSRCQVYVLKPLGEHSLDILMGKAAALLGGRHHKTIVYRERDALYRLAGGDARKLLNAIELVVNMLAGTEGEQIVIDNATVLQIIQENLNSYDKNGENHYDIISAFIKSLRGSDPNAALYYLARMIDGGEDPLFIARRMLILAAEDIGNANPNALLLANSCFDAVHRIGMPEGRIILSQTAIYLATSPKSNAAYQAIEKATRLVQKTGKLPVPLHLRNAVSSLMKKHGYGQGYVYAHNEKGHFASQEYLPEQISGSKLFEPGNNPREQEMANRLRSLWKEKYGY